MSTKSAAEGWYAHTERTSQTDDQRIKDVTPLPPPEHLIRFFPIAGTAIEKLIGNTRSAIRQIMQGKDDRLLVVMGPCSSMPTTRHLPANCGTRRFRWSRWRNRHRWIALGIWRSKMAFTWLP